MLYRRHFSVFRNRFSWSAYWDKLKEDMNFLYEEGTRDGLTLPNAITPGTNDATIKLPVFFSEGIGQYLKVTDNGALNVNVANGFTLCGWYNNKGDKTSIRTCFGKGISGTTSGYYHFNANITTGVYRLSIRARGTNYIIASDIDSTTAGWTFLRMTIDNVNKTIQFFINETQIGETLSFPTYIDTLSNDYDFMVGGSNGGGGVGNLAYPGIGEARDVCVLPFVTTPTQGAALMTNGCMDGALAYWPLAGTIYDASGNNYHLKGHNDVISNKFKSGTGSTHLLNKGYSVWKKTGYEDVIIPFKYDGTAISDPNLTGYIKDKDYTGAATKLNLTPCFITIPTDDWDKSDDTKFNAFARQQVFYDESNPNEWFIKEFNQFTIKNYCIDSHWGKQFFNLSENSITDREEVIEFYSFDTQKTGSDLNKILGHNNDLAVMPEEIELDYYYSDIHWATTRDDKVFAFDEDNSLLKLSLDGGDTFGISKDVSGVIEIIEMAHIFANGNILFCDETKAYYSDDNLATYQECTVLDIAGDPFVPTTYSNFYAPKRDAYIDIDGTEHLFWGNYTAEDSTEYININIWHSKDNGVTLRSVYQCGVTIPDGEAAALDARHSHGATYDPATGDVWLLFGDWADECQFLKTKEGTDFDTETFVWDLLQLAGSGSRFKACGLAFIDDDVIWQADATSEAYENGIYRCKKTEIGDISKSVKIVETSTNGGNGFFSDHDKIIIAVVAGGNYLLISKDGGQSFHFKILTGGPDTESAITRTNYLAIMPKNSDGYHKSDIYEDDETQDNRTKGVCLMLKIS